ncbi:MAG: hypothetical protein RI973_677 [Bacteroidota bacterium]|jgi:hypothetical protein
MRLVPLMLPICRKERILSQKTRPSIPPALFSLRKVARCLNSPIGEAPGKMGF